MKGCYSYTPKAVAQVGARLTDENCTSVRREPIIMLYVRELRLRERRCWLSLQSFPSSAYSTCQQFLSQFCVE